MSTGMMWDPLAQWSQNYVYSGENPLISIEKVYCFCDLDRGQTDLVDVCWLNLHQMYLHMIKICQTQR